VSGLDDVAEALENAAAPGDPHDPPPTVDRDGRDPLPEGCPVTPIGVAGAQRYYLDELRQFVGLTPRDHTGPWITALYGRTPYLLRNHFPKKNENGEVVGWQVSAAAEALMQAAAKRGTWSPNDCVRGPGAWPGEKDGAVILHCGDIILIDGEWQPCGVIGRHVYPAYPPIPRPSEVFAAAGPKGPGSELLNLFRNWAWRRPDIDPELMVGFVCSQMMGGALPWRPTGWVTGEHGFGKSALHAALCQVHGEGGAITTADATEAGLRQVIKFGSLPVLFDEMEPGEDPKKAAAVIGLARRASSGSMSLRGSAGHVEHEFVVRSTFLFFSILVPPLSGAERSRLAIFDLLPLGRRPPPTLSPARLRAIGAALRRRLLDQWQRFQDVFSAYRDALIEGGHAARGADLYGTMLACMDLVLHERSGFEPGELEAWAARLPPGGAGETLDADEPDHQRCLTHLLSAPIDAFRGGVRQTLGQWIERALTGGSISDANALLETCGIKVVIDRARGAGLFIATAHSGLSVIFAGTHWGGGGSKTGPWSQALRRIPGAEIGNAQRFAGAVIKTTWIPATALGSEVRPRSDHGSESEP
jgi:hypothetical protein